MMVEHFPEHLDKIRNAEKEVGRTFFSPDYIPSKYQTGFDLASKKKIPNVDDVIRYVKDKNSNLDMFEEEDKKTDRRCMSFYGICE
jgi:hypothetical protein